MSLVPALLQAIVQASGEAMVMHAGEKPYVVAPTGQIELATRALTIEAVTGIVAQLLPADYQRALEEFDAVQYELPPQPAHRRWSHRLNSLSMSNRTRSFSTRSRRRFRPNLRLSSRPKSILGPLSNPPSD